MNQYYAVIDTNVVVSSLLKKKSNPWMITDKIIKGTIIPLLNKDIFKEYKEVLSRNRFGFNKNEVTELLNIVFKNGIFLDRTPTNEIFIDKDDVIFYEIIVTARKDSKAYLVTGNKKHFPAKPYIVTPKEMLDIINKDFHQK